MDGIRRIKATFSHGWIYASCAEPQFHGIQNFAHKQDDREFYAGDQFKSFESFEKQMLSYNERWNVLRATKALGWRTPDQCIEQAFVNVLTYMEMMKEKYAKNNLSVYDLDKDGNAFVAIPKTQPLPRKINSIKRVTQVDRYLQWLDWDQKKTKKTLLPLPVMSQIYSSALTLLFLIQGGQKALLTDSVRKWCLICC